MLARSLALPVGLAVALGACTHPVEETLASVDSARELPMPFALVYEERDAVLGGQRIEVSRDGQLVRKQWRPGFAPALDAPETLLGEPTEREAADRVTRARVPASALRELAALLVELEAWDQQATEDEIARVEDSRTRLILEVDEGSSTVWEYSQDRARLERVKLVLEGLVGRYEQDAAQASAESPDGADAAPALVDGPSGG